MMYRCTSDLITSFSAKIILKPTQELLRHVHAYQVFDDMPSRDIRSFNSSLAASVRSGDVSSAWSLFLDLHRCRTDLDAYTFTPVLTACSSLLQPVRGQQVHGLMIKLGSNVGTISKTALMDMYSKHGHLGDSVKVFEEVESKDVVTWNAMMSSFLKHGLAKDALSVFGSMRQEKNIELSEFTLCSVLKACTILEAFPQGKQVHGLVTVMGRDLVVLGTALIDFYSKVGHANEAVKVYACFGSCNDSALRNSMIAGCVRNKNYGQAFSIMSSMRPNVIAMTSVLAACSEKSDSWVGKQIHCLAVRIGFTADTQLCNALLDMYAKCGQIEKAKTLFDCTLHKDVVSWTTMIDGYRVHGLGLEAFLLFNKMVESTDALLNSVTLLAVLSACGHSGLVDQGRACFNLAKEKFGLHAEPEHYASFLDGLGRAGRMDDMWEVFHEMVEEKFGDSPKVWTALLNACGLNQDVKRGEGAAKRLMELEPDKPANYVLVSNFYAAVGRWDSVSALRIDMRTKGLTKEAGSSWMLQQP